MNRHGGLPEPLSGRDRLRFDPWEALEVIGKIGQSNLGSPLARPMVRTNRPNRCFWPAKTVATAERTLDRTRLALRWDAVRSWPGCRRKLIFERRPCWARWASLVFEQAVSAQTSLAVLVGSRTLASCAPL